jgi:hypothetical protein
VDSLEMAFIILIAGSFVQSKKMILIKKNIISSLFKKQTGI